MRIWRIPTNTARLLTGVTIIVGVVFSSLFGTPIAVSAPTPIAGDFQSNVLSLSWEPEFCRSMSSQDNDKRDVPKECTTLTSNRYDASNLVLHGLWPNQINDPKYFYGYCNISKDQKHKDENRFWNQLDATVLSESTRTKLSKYMPGYISHLDRHEWTKHGSCSLMDMDQYFSLAVDLTAQVTETHFNKFIATHAGKHFKPDDFYKEFEKDYGAGSQKYVRLTCSQNAPENLKEIHISLQKNLPSNAEIKNSFVAFVDSPKNYCQQEIYVTPVESRHETLDSTLFTESSSPAPLVAKGKPVEWWFAYKFNSTAFPGCKDNAQRSCIFGGNVQSSDKYSQQYVYASSADPTLREGDGCLGDTLYDPVGATFAQLYNNNSLYYVMWNDQFYEEPKIPGDGNSHGTKWGHSKGMIAWNEQGEGFVMQVSTPSWPASGSKLYDRKSGNTLGCISQPNNVLVAQHFFALKLNKEDLLKVLQAMQNASVATHYSLDQIVHNGGPDDIQSLVQQLGEKSSSKQYQKFSLSSGVELISKPSDLHVPPWQFASSVLGGVSLRVATWRGEKDLRLAIPSTIPSTKIECWDKQLGSPGAVENALTGNWARKSIKLGKGSNHAKLGVSSVDSGKTYTIFGDLNQEGTLNNDKDKCDKSQNGRGGLFFVVDNKTLFNSVSKLLEGD